MPVEPNSKHVAFPWISDITARWHSSAGDLGDAGLELLRSELNVGGIRTAGIQNRRYLGNKSAIAKFIRETVDKECGEIQSLIDIFAGTGAVSNAFIDKEITTNDLLYSNYLTNKAWFSPQDYRPGLIIEFIAALNSIHSRKPNYFRKNFANTYFSADDCSKIGEAREAVFISHQKNLISDREHAILVSSILYGMDRIANTVGHYDAYRHGTTSIDRLEFPVILPSIDVHPNNKSYNRDANEIVGALVGDVLYLDPPYNSRQYSDAYHLLENVARWQKPKTQGVAKKMDRSDIKSAYSTKQASLAFRELVSQSNSKFIVLSYNNMGDKGNGRSNAKISDEEILSILGTRGTVKVFEISHRPFNAGKSKVHENSERLFICKVSNPSPISPKVVASPINYVGNKRKLVPSIVPHLGRPELLIDVFSGGCTVGLNSAARAVIFNDSDEVLVSLMSYLAATPPQKVINDAKSIIRKFGLTNSAGSSYQALGTDSNGGLADLNRAPYVALREKYNGQSSRQLVYLYMLVVFGFNNQMRFNKSGNFNLPVGKRDFNSKMQSKLVEYHRRMNSMDYRFSSLDFRSIDIHSKPIDTVFYCDPPYLITTAPYNENGRWTELDERDLLKFLDEIDRSGRKFALSNVLESKGRVNKLLTDWYESSIYHLLDLDSTYSNANYRRQNKESKTREVLITNFETE